MRNFKEPLVTSDAPGLSPFYAYFPVDLPCSCGIHPGTLRKKRAELLRPDLASAPNLR